MAPRRKKDPTQPPPWIHSKAKAKLKSLLLDESSWVQLCTPEEIHCGDKDFEQYPIARFKANYTTLKTRIESEQQSVMLDERAFKQHQEKFPRKATTERGYKFWNKHPAEKRLEGMVKRGETVNRKPSEIREMHPDFQEFPSPVFRSHLYQEQRKAKEGAFWQRKRNETAQKNYRQAEKERRENEL